MRQTFNALPWLTGPGPSERWSPGLYRLLGLSDGAVTGRLDLLLALLHPDDLHLQREIAALAAGARTEPLSVRLVPRDGRVRAVRLLPLEEAGSDGPPRICVLDGSGEAAAADALRREGAALDACLAETGDAVLLLAPDGRVLRASAAARRVFALAPADETLWDRHPGLVGDPLWHFVVGRGGDRADDERWVPALGRWLAYVLLRLEAGVLAVVRDRGELLQLRASFTEASERWRAALEGAGAVPFHLEPDAGEDAPESAGLRFRLGPADLARLRDEGRAAAAGRRPIALDLPCPRSGGTVRVRAAPVGGGSSAVAGLVIADRAPPRPEGPNGAADLSAALVRAARGALRWSVRELADHSGLSIATVNRFEAEAGGVAARERTVEALRAALAAAGLSFGILDGRPALLLRPEAAPAPALPARVA